MRTYLDAEDVRYLSILKQIKCLWVKRREEHDQTLHFINRLVGIIRTKLFRVNHLHIQNCLTSDSVITTRRHFYSTAKLVLTITKIIIYETLRYRATV